MKTTRTITAFCLALTLFYSCVSKKKYNELAKNSKGDYSTLNSQNEELRNNIKELQASTSAELQEKQQQLSEKEKALKERENKLEELKKAMSMQRDAVYNLKQQVCSALKCFSPDELTVDMREGKLYVSLSDKLLFPSGSEDVNKRGKEALEMLSAVLSHSDLEIMVEGHTDPVPISNSRNKDNWDLSVHRATNVTRIMIEQGIKPERIVPCGRGQFKPIASNETAEGKQQNRRTEIVLAPKLDKLWKLTQDEESNPTSQK